MTLLLTILAFGIMIFVHELGHYLAARAFGVGIETFSIGFGKPIAEFKRKGVSWRIGWIPLGGYLKMQDENPDDDDSDEQTSFRKKAWWKKALIALSGPFANLLLGLLLFIVSFLLPLNVEDQRPIIHKAEGKWTALFSPGDSLVSINGKSIKGFSDFLEELLTQKKSTIVISRLDQQQTIQIAPNDADSLAFSILPEVGTRIGEVVPKTAAYLANLMSGDLITAVDSVAVASWYDMRKLIVDSPRDTVHLQISRKGQTFGKTLKLESSISTGNAKAIGIMQDQPIRYKRYFNPVEAVKLGALNASNFVVMNYQMLFQLAKKPSELGKSVGGPVMIATVSQQVGNKGFSYLVLFFGSISLMLMMMNLLPIPILDGGLIMFSIIEGIIRRPIPPRVQSLLQYIGFLLLMALMIFAFYGDISSLILRSIAG